MFSYGFYDSVNGDRRYWSHEMSTLFDGIIRDGVFMSIGDKFFVRPAENVMGVIVGTGRAWFHHTWNLNDSDLQLGVEAADLLMDRIDSVVLDIRAAEEYRKNAIIIVQGELSENPVPPTLINDDLHKQYEFARIYIPRDTSIITADNITYLIGQEPVPWVTGVLETMDTTILIAQWEAEWNAWLKATDEECENWLADRNEWEKQQKIEFTTWIAAQEGDFTKWYNRMKDQLTQDAAGNLQAEIDQTNENLDNLRFSLVEGHTKIMKDENGKTKKIISSTPMNDGTDNYSHTSVTFGTSEEGYKQIYTRIDRDDSPYIYWFKTVTFKPNTTGGKDIVVTIEEKAKVPDLI